MRIRRAKALGTDGHHAARLTRQAAPPPRPAVGTRQRPKACVRLLPSPSCRLAAAEPPAAGLGTEPRAWPRFCGSVAPPNCIRSTAKFFSDVTDNRSNAGAGAKTPTHPSKMQRLESATAATHGESNGYVGATVACKCNGCWGMNVTAATHGKSNGYAGATAACKCNGC
eukprot:COSAG06_NODE_40_length_30318_cov_8.196036_3_plen_169_part_00